LSKFTEKDDENCLGQQKVYCCRAVWNGFAQLRLYFFSKKQFWVELSGSFEIKAVIGFLATFVG